MFFTFFGVGHSRIPLSLSFAMFSVPGLMTIPRNSTSSFSNSHFSGLTKRSLVKRTERTHFVFFLSSSRSFAGIRISSI